MGRMKVRQIFLLSNCELKEQKILENRNVTQFPKFNDTLNESQKLELCMYLKKNREAERILELADWIKIQRN